MSLQHENKRLDEIMEEERVKKVIEENEKEENYKKMVKREKLHVIKQIQQNRKKWELEQEEKKEIG